MTRLSRVLLGGVTGNPEDQLPNCRPLGSWHCPSAAVPGEVRRLDLVVIDPTNREVFYHTAAASALENPPRIASVEAPQAWPLLIFTSGLGNVYFPMWLRSHNGADWKEGADRFNAGAALTNRCWAGGSARPCWAHSGEGTTQTVNDYSGSPTRRMRSL